jgi:hypothetical protein
LARDYKSNIKNETCVKLVDTHAEGMEVYANDREIVEAAVAQDGKLPLPSTLVIYPPQTRIFEHPKPQQQT